MTNDAINLSSRELLSESGFYCSTVLSLRGNFHSCIKLSLRLAIVNGSYNLEPTSETLTWI